MSKEKDYITVTKDGRLFVKSTDFFKHKKVLQIIKELKDTDIYKDIKEGESIQTKEKV